MFNNHYGCRAENGLEKHERGDWEDRTRRPQSPGKEDGGWIRVVVVEMEKWGQAGVYFGGHAHKTWCLMGDRRCMSGTK